MVILRLYNEYNSMTVEKMLDTTQIERELFAQVLVVLLKSKVLSCSNIDPNELNDDFKESNIKFNYIIQVDEDFKSKKIKINLNQPITTVEQKDTETVNQSVDEDRKILIQVNENLFIFSFYLVLFFSFKAAVVRIMKTRKALKHALLIQEVIPQVNLRFKPQIPMIKV